MTTKKFAVLLPQKCLLSSMDVHIIKMHVLQFMPNLSFNTYDFEKGVVCECSVIWVYKSILTGVFRFETTDKGNYMPELKIMDNLSLKNSFEAHSEASTRKNS